MAARVQAFLDDHRGRRGVGPVTCETYRRALVALELHVDVERLTPAAFYDLADQEGWSKNTRASYWTAAKQYSAYRLRNGLAETDEFAEARGPQRPDPNPKPVDDLDSLMELARDRARRRPDSKPVDEWLTLAAYAGLRCFEIARVEREHLRRTAGGWVLDVPQGKGGTNATIPAHPEVVKLFSGKTAGFLYPGETAGSVHSAGKRLMREAGLKGGLHRGRHSFATAIYQKTGDPFRTQAVPAPVAELDARLRGGRDPAAARHDRGAVWVNHPIAPPGGVYRVDGPMAAYQSRELIERALELANRDKELLEPNQRISINWEAQTVATTAIAAAIAEHAAAVTALGIMVGDIAEALSRDEPG
jgi:integrase